MNKLKTITITALLAGSFPAYAGFMMGGPPAEAREAAFETIVSFTDETTAATLQTQRDAVTDLRSQLETLLDAEERDDAAITDIRSQLQDARQALRTDVREVVDSNTELQTALQQQRETFRSERAVSRFALRNDEAFASLVAAATSEQAASLEANQQAIEALKTQAAEARESGASREELQALREEVRGLITEQKDTAGEILEANEALQSEFSASAQELIAEQGRPNFANGRPGRGRSQP